MEKQKRNSKTEQMIMSVLSDFSSALCYGNMMHCVIIASMKGITNGQNGEAAK
jgi:hypothetical protein